MPSRPVILEKLRLKVASLPSSPGVYLFKDVAGVVLYVGKAKNLRSRVGSYFQPGANLSRTRGPDIDRMVRTLTADFDAIECDSEVDALLRENRLIKDIQPRFNERLKDDKSFPYLQISTDEKFPRVCITRQPRVKGARLYGPFVRVYELRAAVPLLQRVFKFRTCNLDLDNMRREHFRPCILHSIRQCTAPCAERVSREHYARQIGRFKKFLESGGLRLRRDIERQMARAATKQQYEQAAELRDELRALEGLQKRGLIGEHPQPEVFFTDPAEGLRKLGELLGLEAPPRTIEGIDIAHLQGGESCGAVVCFIDGRPFKSGYRRYKIKTAAGQDDLACIREVVARRYKQAGANEELFPDVILIDGGKGQLNAALGAFGAQSPPRHAKSPTPRPPEPPPHPPTLIALAKKQEEIYLPGRAKPVKLSRHNPALRLLQSVRDEAHRFAQHYHHILRRKATLQNKTPTKKKKPKNPPPRRQ